MATLRVDRPTAERLFGEAVESTIVANPTKKRRLKFWRKTRTTHQLPRVNPSPVYESSYQLGYATAKDGDEFSYNQRILGDTVTAGVSVAQEKLGAMANQALGESTHEIKLAEGRIRAKSKSLPKWLSPFILVATVVVDSVVANRALSSALAQSEWMVWSASISIALLLAITGFVIAITSVKLFGKGALWVSLIAAILAILSLGFVSTELRGAYTRYDSAVEAQLIAQEASEKNPNDAVLAEEYKNATAKAVDADEAKQRYLMYLYGTLILLTVSAASLSKAYEANQQNEVVDTRTVHRQEQRGKDLALGLSLVSDLRAWIPLSESVQELSHLALSRYVDGYRAGLSPAQLDEFMKNQPQLAVVRDPKWTAEFTARLDSLESKLREFEEDLGMPPAH